jgi:hypothetical protein
MNGRISGLSTGSVGGGRGETGVCKRDWERQKGEGARVSANECVSEMATERQEGGVGAGASSAPDESAGQTWGGSSDLAWLGLGADNDEGEEGEEARELAAPATAPLQPKCRYQC